MVPINIIKISILISIILIITSLLISLLVYKAVHCPEESYKLKQQICKEAGYYCQFGETDISIEFENAVKCYMR